VVLRWLYRPSLAQDREQPVGTQALPDQIQTYSSSQKPETQTMKIAQECIEGFLAFLARRGVAKYHSLCGAVLHQIDKVEDEASAWQQKWKEERDRYEELHTEALCLAEKIEEAGWHKSETQRVRKLLQKW